MRKMLIKKLRKPIPTDMAKETLTNQMNRKINSL